MPDYADYILSLHEAANSHLPECEEQPDGKECICLKIKEERATDEADSRYHDELESEDEQ